MKLSYNTNPTKSSPIPHFAAWFKAAEKAKHDLLVSLATRDLEKLYNLDNDDDFNFITQQQYTAIKNAAYSATPHQLKQLQKALKTLPDHTITSAANIKSTPAFITKIAAEITTNAPHLVSTKTLEMFELDDTPANRWRCCDILYISKKLKQEWRKKEADFSFLLSATAVPTTALKWTSDLAKRHYEYETDQAEKFANNYSMRNAKGDIISGTKLFDKNTRDKNKYNEEIAIVRGLSDLAEEEGNTISALITITLPSEFHPLRTCQKTRTRIKNPKFNGCTIKEAHDFFQECWVLTRANLAYQGNEISHFVRAAQPHKTSVPHYHLTAFLRDETHLQAVVKELSKQLNQPWMITKNKTYKTKFGTSTKNPKIRGIRADIFTNKKGEIDIMGATNYIMASLAYIMPDDSHDAKTGRSSEEVKAIKGWARAYKIKRFTTSHGHRTLWRKLRAADDFNSEAQRHAKAGKYAAFYRTLHITKNNEVIKKGTEYFKTFKVQKINKYGETVEVPDTIFMLNINTGYTHSLDVSAQWEIFKEVKLTLTDKNQVNPTPKPKPETQKPPHPPPKIEFSAYI